MLLINPEIQVPARKIHTWIHKQGQNDSSPLWANAPDIDKAIRLECWGGDPQLETLVCWDAKNDWGSWEKIAKIAQGEDESAGKAVLGYELG